MGILTVIPGDSGRQKGEQIYLKSGGEPLEVDRRRHQVKQYLHVVQTTSHRSSQPVSSLCLPVETLRAPAVSLVHSTLFLAPSHMSTTGPEQRRIIMQYHNLPLRARGRQARAVQRTARAVEGSRMGKAFAPALPHITGRGS